MKICDHIYSFLQFWKSQIYSDTGCIINHYFFKALIQNKNNLFPHLNFFQQRLGFVDGDWENGFAKQNDLSHKERRWEGRVDVDFDFSKTSSAVSPNILVDKLARQEAEEQTAEQV